jgi:hypothetical protein
LVETKTPEYVRQYGFPFTFYEWRFGSAVDKVGSLTFYSTVKKDGFIWFGVIGNIASAIIFSFSNGLIVKFFWAKRASRRLNLK